MIIYVEKKALLSPLTQEILKKFSHCEIVEIQHYKDIFDKTIGNYHLEPCIILAKQEHIAILESPDTYGFPGKSFFFKPSLNCFFDCSYCYLKGSFKNRFPVIFVNYEEMQQEISKKVEEERKRGYTDQITFYASNYADVLAIESLTHFHQQFLPFFEQFEHVLLETRTKSANIEELILLARKGNVFKNTEIAFSLSPEPITNEYEKGTASLQKKLEAIQILLELKYRVGLRFLPLLPVENYWEVYEALIEEVKKHIDTAKISSIFIAPLIYNKGDFSVMKKVSSFPFLTALKENENGMMKMDEKYYQDFEELFVKHFPNQHILWDYQ